MTWNGSLEFLWQGGLFDTLVPDFLLGAVFFTALIFGVLSRRFEHRRSAAAMSAALGLALASGLVWWEMRTGRSIRDLGPVAAGLAMIVLAMTIYQAVSKIGGRLASGALAFGAALLIGSVLGVADPLRSGGVQLFMLILLLAGAAVLVTRSQTTKVAAGGTARGRRSTVYDFGDTRRLEEVSEQIGQRLDESKDRGPWLERHPEQVDNYRRQLDQLLPAEGWLTERLAALRERYHQARSNQAAQIKEISDRLRSMPAKARKRVSGQIAQRYRAMRCDERLERLDAAVAKEEQSVRQLTLRARQLLDRGDYEKMTGLLDEASKLQHQASQLIKSIERAESKLLKEIKKIVDETPDRRR